MNRHLKTTFLLLLWLLALAGLIKGGHLPSNMDQTLFISKNNLLSLQKFEKKFGKDQNLILFTPKINSEQLESISNTHPINLDKHFSFSSTSATLLAINSPKELRQYEEQLNKIFSDQWSLAGMAWTNYHLGLENQKIQKTIFPLVFVFIGILLIFILRNYRVAIFTFVNALTTTGFSFWWLILLKGEVHILTNLIPLMNFVIPLALMMHLLYGFHHLKTLKAVWKEKRQAILLTSITTIAGIASLSLSPIPVIKDFALLGALSLTLNFALTFLLFYLSLPWLTVRLQKAQLPMELPFRRSPVIGKRSAWAGSFLIIVAGFFVLSHLPILVEAEKFFAKNHPVSIGAQQAVNTLGGLPFEDWVITKKNSLPSISYEELKNIDRELENTLNSDYRILGPTTLLKAANKVYTDQEKLPDFEISARTLYAQIPQALKQNNWQSHDLRFTLLNNPSLHSFEQLEQKRQDLQKKWGDRFTVESNGMNYQVIQSQRTLVKSLLSSFLLSFFISLLVVSFFLKDIKKIGTFIIVNLAPVALATLAFPLLNMQINMASVMSFSVSFGLIVDGTIHLLCAKEQRKLLHMPIFLSNVLIIIAFGMLGLHDFVPIWQFGISLSLILIFGLFFDLVVLELTTDDTPQKI